MRLYDSGVSGNCYKVRLLLAQLGLDYERVELDVVDRSNRPDVLGGLNPALRVPTLVLDDGRALGESNAILWWLAEGSAFLPTDPFERAQVLQWQFFEQYDHEPNVAVARFWLTKRPGEADPAQLAAWQAAGHRVIGAMDAAPRDARLPRRRALLGRRHLALCVHARRTRGWDRARALSGGARLARPRQRAAGPRPHHCLTRFPQSGGGDGRDASYSEG